MPSLSFLACDGGHDLTRQFTSPVRGQFRQGTLLFALSMAQMMFPVKHMIIYHAGRRCQGTADCQGRASLP